MIHGGLFILFILTVELYRALLIQSIISAQLLMLLPRLSVNPTICGLIRPEVAALGPLPLVRSLWLSLCQLLGEVVGIHYGCLFPIRSELGPSTSIFNPLIQVLFDLLVHFVEFLLLIIFSLFHHFGLAEALGTLGIVYSESSIR